MKITKSTLQRIIQEEVQAVVEQQSMADVVSRLHRDMDWRTPEARAGAAVLHPDAKSPEGHVAAAQTKLAQGQAAAADLLNEPVSDEEVAGTAVKAAQDAAIQESHLQQIVQEEIEALLRR